MFLWALLILALRTLGAGIGAQIEEVILRDLGRERSPPIFREFMRHLRPTGCWLLVQGPVKTK